MIQLNGRLFRSLALASEFIELSIRTDLGPGAGVPLGRAGPGLALLGALGLLLDEALVVGEEDVAGGGEGHAAHLPRSDPASARPGALAPALAHPSLVE